MKCFIRNKYRKSLKHLHSLNIKQGIQNTTFLIFLPRYFFFLRNIERKGVAVLKLALPFNITHSFYMFDERVKDLSKKSAKRQRPPIALLLSYQASCIIKLGSISTFASGVPVHSFYHLVRAVVIVMMMMMIHAHCSFQQAW